MTRTTDVRTLPDGSLWSERGYQAFERGARERSLRLGERPVRKMTGPLSGPDWARPVVSILARPVIDGAGEG